MGKWVGTFFNGERRVKFTGQTKAAVHEKYERMIRLQRDSMLSDLRTMLDDSERTEET
jgi:hypothetical protein